MAKQTKLTGPLYTTAPAAARAGCSVETLRAKVRQGIVTPMQINGGVNPVNVFSERDIAAVRKSLYRRG